MNVLVLNCGSTSVKFRLMVMGARPARALAGGAVERIGALAEVVLWAEARPLERRAEGLADHDAAVQRALQWVASCASRIDAVGHRVVHGGERFTRPILVDDDVLAALQALETLAPLHNGPAIAGIRAARARLGSAVPMVAAFDTAFHATLPAPAARYAIPEEVARRHGVRRYGFHGLAYRSVLAGYAELAGIPTERTRLVAFHLGGGASAAAIAGGRSVDTSMGFTPLEGLIMATRSGDIDPAVVPYLAERQGWSAAEVVAWLNEHAGLHGVSGTSADMRDLLAREANDPRASLAVELFCYRARKYLGAYLAVLGGADAVLFSGGVGERAPEVRARICAGFEWCGLGLDASRNAAVVGDAGRISADGGRVAAWVVPADEERIIAEDVAACLEPARAHRPT